MRTEFTTATKRAARDRANGHCEECGVPLRDGGFHFDHIIPDALGGDNSLENCSVCCKTCHGVKTRTQDIPRIAKAKRQADRAAGIKSRTSRPIMGSKASGWKHKVNGDWEKRQ